jgi:glycogen synthase
MTTVLMTTDAVGGVWTYCLDLCDGLAALDIDVVLAVLGPPPTRTQETEAASRAVRALHHIPGALEWMDNPWNDVDRAGRQLLHLASRIGPDIVHINGFSHAALPFDAPVVVAAHSDVLSWWRAVLGSWPPNEWSTYQRRVEAGLCAADLVVAPTVAVSDDLRRAYGTEHVRVVPNGRHDLWPTAAPKEPFVLAMGRMWDAAKNLRALEQAARYVDWRVMVAGQGAPDADATAGSVGARHLGPLSSESVPEWLGRAAIFASPAKYEPFGLAALEAGLARCALVLGDLPSLREVWGDAALFVDPDDPDDLALTLQQLIEQPDQCIDWGRRARRRATEFGSNRMAQGYADLYRSIQHPESRRVLEDAS